MPSALGLVITAKCVKSQNHPPFYTIKRRNDFLNPISRQYFASAFAETPNLNLEVRHILQTNGELKLSLD